LGFCRLDLSHHAGGATERVRIDSIPIISSPPPWDRTSDGGWFVDADYRTFSGGYDPVTDVDWALVHELSHQVGLIDLYNLNLSSTSVKVLDREGGRPTWGSAGPARPDGWRRHRAHLDPHLYSSHSAGGISATKGYRRGYYGEYQFDIPEQNTLLILDNQGNPAGDVQVALYQRTGPPKLDGRIGPGQHTRDHRTTDADGRLLLADRPAGGGVTTRTGHTLRDKPLWRRRSGGNQSRFLIRLNKGDHERVCLDRQSPTTIWPTGKATLSAIPLPSPPMCRRLTHPHHQQVPRLGSRESRPRCAGKPAPSADLIGYYVYRAAPRRTNTNGPAAW